jgi:hypothetical protein
VNLAVVVDCVGRSARFQGWQIKRPELEHRASRILNMTRHFSFPYYRAISTTGTPLANAKLYFFLTGTSTPATVYADLARTTPLSDPVVADANGMFPLIFVDPDVIYRVRLTNSANVQQWQEDGVPLQLFPQTEAERLALQSPVNYSYAPVPEDIRRFGATDAGGAPSTTRIQAAVDALNTGSIAGGSILAPGDANSVYNISGTIVIPARASGDNHTRWYAFRGMGRGSPRITAIAGMVDKPMIAASGQDASTYSFYREFSDFYLNGAGIAQRGIELYYNQHLKVENVFITGLDDGTSNPTNAAGVRVFGAICSQFRDVKVHNCDGHGIFAKGGSGNFFNANLVEGCSFLALTGTALYFTGGCSGCSILGNTLEHCAYGMRFSGTSAGGTVVSGNYFEENKFADISLGEDTSQETTTIEGNYLNGYSVPGNADSTYTPVKLKFGNNITIRGNQVATATRSPSGYRFLDANITGGTVTYCTVENNAVMDLAASTAPNTIYNLPGAWVNNGNRLIDPQFAPLIETNICRGRLPYGGWVHSVSGAGTAVRSATDLHGAPALQMTRPGAGDSSSTSQVFTVGPEFKNRFVTVGVPIRDTVGSKNITVEIAPNGTSPQTTTISIAWLGANEQTIVYAMGFAPADATTITVTITVMSSGADFIVGHPCLYVGARPWYSAAGDQDWRNDTAPTTGTWQAGDKVWLNNAVSGAKMGYVRSAAGTWVNMSNYA